ncbi:hypothetical protein AG1IA_08190 [Rhizoctonia solani AG-1 IA]|uniref:Uncharacterized protein n=1 Tax=Thanatephorus cucumeris (strain AG1-IA) TaxID=983506 RepID=L8WHW8_THACA|nr:hypothetical protein AG1IA_08190 [Rhizoctonia solani AG-1 IA]
MVSTLDLDLRPGSGIGPFELGASLFDVLDFLRRPSPPTFPSISVKYDTASPANSPIILHLRPHLDLLFTRRTQRLHTISLSLLRNSQIHIPLVLSYKNEVLSGPDVIPHRTAVQRMMGPTYKGEHMRYPGVWFSFEDDVPIAVGATNATEGNAEVKRVVVTQREEQIEQELEEDSDELVPSSNMYGELKKAVIKVSRATIAAFHQLTNLLQIHDGIYLHFFTPDPEDPPIRVRLGVTTAQDLICDLGPPVLTHYKVLGMMRKVVSIKMSLDTHLALSDAAPPAHSTDLETTTKTTEVEISAPKGGGKKKKKVGSERPRTSFEVQDDTPSHNQETIAFYDSVPFRDTRRSPPCSSNGQQIFHRTNYSHYRIQQPTYMHLMGYSARLVK